MPLDKSPIMTRSRRSSRLQNSNNSKKRIVNDDREDRSKKQCQSRVGVDPGNGYLCKDKDDETDKSGKMRKDEHNADKCTASVNVKFDPYLMALNFCVKCAPLVADKDDIEKVVHHCIIKLTRMQPSRSVDNGVVNILYYYLENELVMAINIGSWATPATTIGRVIEEAVREASEMPSVRIQKQKFEYDIFCIPLTEFLDVFNIKTRIVAIQSGTFDGSDNDDILGMTLDDDDSNFVHNAVSHACFCSDPELKIVKLYSKWNLRPMCETCLWSRGMMEKLVPFDRLVKCYDDELHFDMISRHRPIEQGKNGGGGREKLEEEKNYIMGKRGGPVPVAPPPLRPVDHFSGHGQQERLMRLCSCHPDSGAREKISSMMAESEQNLHPGASGKVRNWLALISRIPFEKYSDGFCSRLTSCAADEVLMGVNSTLDEITHGMHSAKTAILETAAKIIVAPRAPLRALLLEGPPGCGKTTFVTRAVGKALNRPVRVMNLGGAKDSKSLLGFPFTYEGSKPGAIFENVVASGVSDPILVIDEIDKISEGYDGKEIANVLMALTDPTQNHAINDNYASGVSMDLSRAFIIFTCNNIQNVDPILLDRVRVVNVTAPSFEEKQVAIVNFIIPRIAMEMGLSFDGQGTPPLFTEDVRVRDELTKKMLTFCEQFEGMGGSGGMRGIEKLAERILMNSNIRRISGNKQQQTDRAPTTKVELITKEDVYRTIDMMKQEKIELEKRRSDCMGGPPCSMYS